MPAPAPVDDGSGGSSPRPAPPADATGRHNRRHRIWCLEPQGWGGQHVSSFAGQLAASLSHPHRASQHPRPPWQATQGPITPQDRAQSLPSTGSDHCLTPLGPPRPTRPDPTWRCSPGTMPRQRERAPSSFTTAAMVLKVPLQPWRWRQQAGERRVRRRAGQAGRRRRGAGVAWAGRAHHRSPPL